MGANSSFVKEAPHLALVTVFCEKNQGGKSICSILGQQNFEKQLSFFSWGSILCWVFACYERRTEMHMHVWGKQNDKFPTYMEIKRRRQNILCCITEYYDQHKANGLTFMLVPRYGRYSFLFFLSGDKTCWNLKLNEVLHDFLIILKQGTIGEYEGPNSSPYFVVSLICLRNL